MLIQRCRSSGQQILETIQPQVAHLTSFIRQGAWIFGPFGPSPPRDYSEAEINNFVHKHGVLLEVRKKNESRINSAFKYFLSDSEEQATLRSHITQEMKGKLQNPALEDILIPKTGVGCRRPTPGIRYLESLTASNVTLVHGPISAITPTGCIDAAGTTHTLDVLICATGFETSYIPRFPLLGHGGKNLQTEWAVNPQAYLATAAATCPNYFMFYGPNNPWASGSYLSMIDCQAEYMLKLLDRYQSENIHSFTPKAEAVAEFMEHAARILERTVWAEECSSWYKHGERMKKGAEDGGSPPSRLEAAKSLTLWPGSGLHFMEAMAEVRWEDWEVVYRGNRFEWLGNGFSRTEVDAESDLAWYIRERDESPWLSREMRRRVATRKRGRGDCAICSGGEGGEKTV